jgi:hypothetical protein
MLQVGDPRFAEVAKGAQGNGRSVRSQATRSYTEATRACYKKIAVLIGKSSIDSEILEKSV